MKLSELNPSWVVGDVMKCFPMERGGMGLSFDCPVHRNHRLVVMFSNPIDGQPPVSDQNLWHRDGEDFESLTLGPSIDSNCWHGHIVNGEVTTV